MKSTSNFSKVNCQNQTDIYSKISMLVDDELPQDERIQLLAEINRNPEYKKVYEQEMKFKAYIQKNASQKKAPESLINSLKENFKLPADN